MIQNIIPSLLFATIEYEANMTQRISSLIYFILSSVNENKPSMSVSTYLRNIDEYIRIYRLAYQGHPQSWMWESAEVCLCTGDLKDPVEDWHSSEETEADMSFFIFPLDHSGHMLPWGSSIPSDVELLRFPYSSWHNQWTIHTQQKCSCSDYPLAVNTIYFLCPFISSQHCINLFSYFSYLEYVHWILSKWIFQLGCNK